MFSIMGRIVGAILVVLAILAIIAIFGYTPHFTQVFHDLFHWAYNTAIWFIAIISEPGISETLAVLALLLLIGIPILMMLIGGVRLMFGLRGRTQLIGAVAWFFWVISLLLLTILIILSVSNFIALRKTTIDTPLTPTHYPVIYVELDTSRHVDLYKDTWADYQLATLYSFWHDEGNLVRGIPSLSIIHSRGGDFSITTTKEARGESQTAAEKNAESIMWEFRQLDSLIIIDPYFFFARSSGWRNQGVKVQIDIPQGKQIVICPELKRMMEVNISYPPGSIGL